MRLESHVVVVEVAVVEAVEPDCTTVAGLLL